MWVERSIIRTTVLSFLSSRPNWDPPPPPHPQASVTPPPLVPGGTYSLAREGVDPNSDEGTDTVVL